MLPRVTDISQAEKGFNLEINVPIPHTLCLVEEGVHSTIAEVMLCFYKYADAN